VKTFIECEELARDAAYKIISDEGYDINDDYMYKQDTPEHFSFTSSESWQSYNDDIEVVVIGGEKNVISPRSPLEKAMDMEVRMVLSNDAAEGDDEKKAIFEVSPAFSNGEVTAISDILIYDEDQIWEHVNEKISGIIEEAIFKRQC
jgi:hypothetical protein